MIQNISFGKEFTVNGQFDSQNEYEQHQIALEGDCTISGQSEGYSNQAFFSSLLNSNEAAITAMSNSAISTNDLDLGYYFIGASLLQNPSTGYGSYYPYDPEHSKYTLSISCPDFNEDIESIADLLNITIDNSSYDAVNSLPIVVMENTISIEQDNNAAIPYNVTDTDNDTVTSSITQQPSNGTAEIGVSNITYTPNSSYYGTDSFVVSFDDGNG